MENKDTEIIANSRPTHIVNSKRLSDAVIIEIVHGIKEIIVELINRKYQPIVYHDKR
ncbi:MAG: hypothetical protein Q8N92_10925 [Erysipelotrichaceae bacterium]|nr:hypothetical protein [Erysipelotrichaceae bacterium]